MIMPQQGMVICKNFCKAMRGGCSIRNLLSEKKTKRLVHSMLASGKVFHVELPVVQHGKARQQSAFWWWAHNYKIYYRYLTDWWTPNNHTCIATPIIGGPPEPMLSCNGGTSGPCMCQSLVQVPKSGLLQKTRQRLVLDAQGIYIYICNMYPRF